MNRCLVFSLFLLLSLFILPKTASAYFESISVGDLRADVYPEQPGPSQAVAIRLGSYLLNLDTCNISWQQDGQTTKQGIGEKNYAFQTPPLAGRIALTASVACPNGQTTTKDFVFQSNDVDLLLSADTYVPAFYRGNTRPSAGSSVKIVALPQVFDAAGNLMEAKNLVYKWTKNGKAMTISSGYGKNAVTINTSEGTATGVAVEISSLAGEFKASRLIAIPATSPQILIYEAKPLLGLQSQRSLIGTANLTEIETNLIAEPYFFNNQSLVNGQTKLDWQMNGKSIPSTDNGRSAILRYNKGESGEATITVSGRDTSQLLSQTQTELGLKFGQTTNSIFGF